MNKVEIDMQYILELYLSDECEMPFYDIPSLFVLNNMLKELDELKMRNNKRINVKVMKLMCIFQKCMKIIAKEVNNGTD